MLVLGSTYPVAIIAGTLLPHLAARDRRLLKPTQDASEIDTDDSDAEVDAELNQIREMVRDWKAEAARHGRPLRLPTSKSRPFDKCQPSQCPLCFATFGLLV